MQTARAKRWSTTLWLLAALLPAAAGAADPKMGLAAAVRQALEANLDLEAQRRSLEADSEQIDIARSTLLPQIGVGLRGQVLDNDRADGARGNSAKESATVSAPVDGVTSSGLSVAMADRAKPNQRFVALSGS